ncbi:MAG TPA: serine/threonine-protein kinase [Gemmatimonadales bacterium]|nr:serine/threonine-protein kinase [Gemmatimonadales bacterium]
MTGIPIRLAAILAGRFHLERELGAGGMATVYLATDLRHDRKVAIKVMHPDLAAALGEERFLREVRITANLQHPHIVPLFDSGTAEGQLYFIMPYVEGETLRERLRRAGALPTDEALRLLAEIADALAHAHAHGIIHRDLKPENILLAGRHVVVADFGVSKAVTVAAYRAPDLTQFGAAVGTPAYMSPEQAMGEAGVDQLADIYALGVLGYEMLSGVPPFSGATAEELAAAHLTRVPERLSRLRPGISGTIDSLVMRCLEKRPADRWQSAEEVHHQLAVLTSEQAMAALGVQPAPEPVDLLFPLADEICGSLDRTTLDPRVIGGELHYLDNLRESPVLVCFLHAVGADQRQFEPAARTLPYRVLVPTAFGCEPDARQHISLSLEDHLVLLRAFLADAIARLAPSRVIIAGFSAGADVGFRLLSADDPLPGVDGYLALSCNLNLETCFATRRLAKLSGDEQSLLADLQALSASTSSLELWLLVHEYFVGTIRKFTGNTEVLRRLAADIVRPFQAAGESTFVQWYRTVTARVGTVRCLFEDAEPYLDILAQLRLRHLDDGVLGPRHRQGALGIVPGANHFSLLAPALLRAELDAMLATLERG